MATTKVDVNLIDASGITSSKYLKGDGTWGTVDALPSQTSQSGKFLTTDGSDASWAVAASGFDDMEAFTSSQSYTIPAGITKQVFYVTGGGGGGGGANVSLGASAGSAGGTVIKTLSLAADTIMSIVIGTAAAGGGAGVDGTIGVDTTVTYTSGGTSFVTLTGPGGKPGKYGYNGVASVAPTGGDINLAGGAGGSGGYGGGSGYWGGGGVSAYKSAAGTQASTPGLANGSGGGSGSPSSGVNAASAGAVGIVVIYLYK